MARERVDTPESRYRRARIQVFLAISPFAAGLLLGTAVWVNSFFSGTQSPTDSKAWCKMNSQTTERTAVTALGRPTQSGVFGDPPQGWEDWRFPDVEYNVTYDSATGSAQELWALVTDQSRSLGCNADRIYRSSSWYSPGSQWWLEPPDPAAFQ